ncbi:MAG: fibronectin type III domain-containing protein [Ruminococcus sp.]|nr:fibronectin type III domain-containing protein [Ruminococcus sp.]
MSTNRVNLSNAVRFIFVNLLFLLISVVIISQCVGTGLAAKAEGLSEDEVITEAELKTAAQSVVRLENVLGLKANSADVTSVTLSWNEVNGAEGYNVYQYNNTKKAWVCVGKTEASINTSYTVSRLTAGTNYEFAVKAYAIASDGRELLSTAYTTVSATTYLSNVSGFKASTVSSSEVKLSWNKVSGAKGYIVYRYDNANKKWVRVTKTSTNVNTYTVKNLKSGTNYKFAVKAYKTLNGKEVVSKTYPTVTEYTNPANVTGFKTAGTTTDAIKLSWNKVSGAQGYIVYKYDSSKKKYIRVVKTNGTNNTYTVGKLKAGTTYKFAVKAYVTSNGKEITSKSYPAINASTNLATVSGFKVSSVSSSAAKLSWTKVSGAKGYVIYQYDNSKKAWKRVTKTASNVNTYTVSNLSGSTTYKFAIKAYKTLNGKEVLSKTYPTISATTKKLTLAKPVMVAEKKYESTATHPYNKQTNTLIVNWKKVSNAKTYQLYIKGGKYGSWTAYKTVSGTSCTVSGLERAKTYSFRVRAVNGKTTSEFSSTQNLKTARMNFDAAGWEAMCRIVYHEVGQMNSDLWDKPIVYVSDCVVNRYVAAKYGGNNNWSAAYKNYSNIQSIIYNSGGFMSSAGLANDGAVYSRVPAKVKTAVYGAVYDIAAYKNIENDGSVYFWCNRSYYQSDSRIAYTFKIPWGYFNIWTAYWG